jgi:hypothetical protein
MRLAPMWSMPRVVPSRILISACFCAIFSALSHVQAARVADSGPLAGAVQVARDINGREVLATYAPVARPRLGWVVVVELPIEEANPPAQ